MPMFPLLQVILRRATGPSSRPGCFRDLGAQVETSCGMLQTQSARNRVMPNRIAAREREIEKPLNERGCQPE